MDFLNVFVLKREHILEPMSFYENVFVYKNLTKWLYVMPNEFSL